MAKQTRFNPLFVNRRENGLDSSRFATLTHSSSIHLEKTKYYLLCQCVNMHGLWVACISNLIHWKLNTPLIPSKVPFGQQIFSMTLITHGCMSPCMSCKWHMYKAICNHLLEIMLVYKNIKSNKMWKSTWLLEIVEQRLIPDLPIVEHLKFPSWFSPLMRIKRKEHE